MTLCWELTFQRHIPKVDHSSALIGGILCMRSMYSTLSELVSSMSENLAVSGTVNLQRSWKACKWNPWRKTEKCRFVKQMSCRQWLWTRKLHTPFPWYCSRPYPIPTASKISSHPVPTEIVPSQPCSHGYCPRPNPFPMHLQKSQFLSQDNFKSPLRIQTHKQTQCVTHQ